MDEIVTMDSLKSYIKELYKKYGEIQIKCEGSNSLPIDTLIPFQGDLKKISKKNLKKLIYLIFRHGFVACFYVWNHEGDWKILDGHGRLRALLLIRETGVPIPGLFPISFIHAETEKEAREILLSITSSFGEFQKEVLDDWIADIDIEIAESLRITDRELNLAIASLDDPVNSEEESEEDSVFDGGSPTDMVKLTVTGITREEAKELMSGYIDRGFEVRVK